VDEARGRRGGGWKGVGSRRLDVGREAFLWRSDEVVTVARVRGRGLFGLTRGEKDSAIEQGHGVSIPS
jgi:hypothetical protein